MLEKIAGDGLAEVSPHDSTALQKVNEKQAGANAVSARVDVC